MDGFTSIVVIICIAILVIGFMKLFRKPAKFIVKLLLNTLCGFIALVLINLVGTFIGVAIGINWLNAAIVGILGVPGVALLLILQWLLLI